MKFLLLHVILPLVHGLFHPPTCTTIYGCCPQQGRRCKEAGLEVKQEYCCNTVGCSRFVCDVEDNRWRCLQPCQAISKVQFPPICPSIPTTSYSYCCPKLSPLTPTSCDHPGAYIGIAEQCCNNPDSQCAEFECNGGTMQWTCTQSC